MADLGINFDASQIAPPTFDLLPKGDYLARIIESESGPNSKQTGTILKLTLEICEGQFAGRKLYDQINLSNPNEVAVKIGQERLSSYCHATGVMVVQNSEALHNIPMMVRVVIKVDKTGEYDDRNEIRSVKKAAAQTDQQGFAGQQGGFNGQQGGFQQGFNGQNQGFNGQQQGNNGQQQNGYASNGNQNNNQQSNHNQNNQNTGNNGNGGYANTGYANGNSTGFNNGGYTDNAGQGYAPNNQQQNQQPQNQLQNQQQQNAAGVVDNSPVQPMTGFNTDVQQNQQQNQQQQNQQQNGQQQNGAKAPWEQ